MTNNPDQEISYTLELESKQQAEKRDIKKLIYTIFLMIIVCGAACALIFGIDIAKRVV